MRTFYDILGVNNNATQEEITIAYRKKVIENHPDRGGDAIEFINIRKGYEILSNPKTRKRYDNWLKNKNTNRQKEDWDAFMHSFVMNICKDNRLCTLIINIFENDKNLYRYINTTPTYIIAAEFVKNSLTTIRSSHPELNVECLKLDSICNDIILGLFSHKTNTRGKNSTTRNDNYKNKDVKDSERINLFRVTAIVLIIFLILGVFLFTNAPKNGDKSYKTDVAYPTNKDTNNANISKTNPDVTYQETTYKTGDIPYKDYFGKGIYDTESLSELTIVNYSPTDAVVLLVTLDGDVIRNNFIKHKSVFTMEQIPSSSCKIKVMFGNFWNSGKDNGINFPSGGFTEDISFMESDDIFFFYAIKEDNRINYPTYSITLHKVENGNMRTSSINKEEFFL